MKIPLIQRDQVFQAIGSFYRSPRNLAVLGLGICLVWVFWPTLAVLADKWGHDSQYSHGYVVPLFALYLLWQRRDQRTACQPNLWGLLFLGLGLGSRFAGTYLYFDWFQAIAILPCLMGLFLLWGGGVALRWAWPAIAFLVFMVPLPFRLETALAYPLQRIATITSTYILQTIGFIAYSEGNVIHLGPIRIGVVEACSGLSMLLIFFALSTAVCMVIRRPFLEKAVIFASAVPIALLANIIRIVVTAVLHKTVGSEIADYVFHDLAGWLMMPLALVLLLAEMRLYSWLIVDGHRGHEQPAPIPFSGRRPRPNGSPILPKIPGKDKMPVKPDEHVPGPVQAG